MKPPPWVIDAARAGYRRAPRWVQEPIRQRRHQYAARATPGNRPALSVVMPVYNVERYLRQAVDSVLTQNFRDLELILVDDGSTDASGRMCDTLTESDARIRVIHKANEGLSAARNTGIAAARGEYLAFIDSDDYVLPGAYSAMMRSLQKSDSDVVTGNVVRLDGKRYTQSWNQSRSHLLRASATTLTAHPELVFDTVTWNKIYRREFWDINVKAFPVGKLYEDIVPVFKAFLFAKGVDILPRTVYVWRRRDEKDSITQRLLEPRNVTDRFEMIDIVDELIRTHRLPSAVAERFRFKILEGDLWIYVRELTDDTDPAVQQRLRQAVDRYWTTAPEAVAARMPAERRVAYWLVGSDRAADVPAFLRWYWDFGRQYAVTRRDGAVMLQASASPVSLDGIPEPDLRVGSRANRSAPSQMARRVYKRLPHRVRRPVVRARQGLSHQAQSSRQVIDRLVRRPTPAAAHEAVIDDITCTPAGDLQISFAVKGGRDVDAAIAPASGSPTWVAAERIADRYLVRLPTVQEEGRRPLPSGTYRLTMRTTGAEPADDVRVRVAGALHLPRVFLSESAKVRVRPGESGTIVAEISAPVPDDVLARPVQAELRARYGRTPREVEDAVLFQVDVGFGSADSALAIGAELRGRGVPLKLYWGVEDLSVATPEWATPVVKLSEDWYAKLNGSRYIVNNYGGAWGLTKDASQRYLQTWHGTPLKFIGVSEARLNRAGETRLQNIAREAADWDAAVSPSPYFSRILADELLFKGRVLEVGYPRNDRLARATAEDREAARTALGIDPDARILLYAPTYREGRRRGWRAPLYQGLDLTRLLAQLGPDWRVLLRGHSFNARHDPSDRSAGRVVDVTRHQDINDLYIASDALVTDYSSVMFDYAVTGKPMAFFVPDLDHYAAVRGMYLDLADIAPGPLCGEVTELADQLAEPDKLRQAHADKYAQFREQFAPWDDGNAAARVVDAFFDGH